MRHHVIASTHASVWISGFYAAVLVALVLALGSQVRDYTRTLQRQNQADKSSSVYNTNLEGNGQ